MEFTGYLKNVLDAFIIGEAAFQNQVRSLTVRPEIHLRSKITDGMTIIFNETLTGMKRWTDGKVWSISKLRNGFFVYEDKSWPSGSPELSSPPKLSLFKKVITIVAPNNHTLHIINYFYASNPEGDNVNPDLKRPIEFDFQNREQVLKRAKEYRYFKCFRARSNRWKKLYHAPSVNPNESATQLVKLGSSELSPSSERSLIRNHPIELKQNSDEIIVRSNTTFNIYPNTQDSFRNYNQKLPSISILLDCTLSSSLFNPYPQRHSEDLRQLKVLDSFI